MTKESTVRWQAVLSAFLAGVAVASAFVFLNPVDESPVVRVSPIVVAR